MKNIIAIVIIIISISFSAKEEATPASYAGMNKVNTPKEYLYKTKAKDCSRVVYYWSK